MNAIVARLLSHLSSVTIVAMLAIYYLLGDMTQVKSFLPSDGKSLTCVIFVFIIVAGVVLFELSNKRHNDLTRRLTELSTQTEVNSVKGAIAGLYRMYRASNGECITDESIIREIHATSDGLKRLGINSYSQQKIEFLVSKIDLDRRE